MITEESQGSILLTGMKHTGKSSHGRALARALSLPFLDLDDLILQLYHSRGGSAARIRELYRQEGKGHFMALETEAAEKCINVGGSSVVATGGGIADNKPALWAFRHSSAAFFFIHLSLPEKILFQRICNGGLPPFLEGEGGEKGAQQRFHQLYVRRESLYRQQADLVIELDNKPLEENSSVIIEAAIEVINRKEHV
jgi:shikimate kinase